MKELPPIPSTIRRVVEIEASGLRRILGTIEGHDIPDIIPGDAPDIPPLGLVEVKRRFLIYKEIPCGDLPEILGPVTLEEV